MYSIERAEFELAISEPFFFGTTVISSLHLADKVGGFIEMLLKG